MTDRRIEITVKRDWIKVEVSAPTVGTFQRTSFQQWDQVLLFVMRARANWAVMGSTSSVVVRVEAV